MSQSTNTTEPILSLQQGVLVLQQNKSLIEANSGLSQSLLEAVEFNDSLIEVNEELTTANNTLRTQIKALQKAIDGLKVSLSELGQQNEALKSVNFGLTQPLKEWEITQNELIKANKELQRANNALQVALEQESKAQVPTISSLEQALNEENRELHSLTINQSSLIERQNVRIEMLDIENQHLVALLEKTTR